MPSEIHYSTTTRLSAEAAELLEFDMASLRQLLRARRASEPAIWLADPEGYQSENHVLRDSPSIRLLAYSEDSGLVYATDGCNSCMHTMEAPLADATPAELESVSDRTQLPVPMLERLVELLRRRISDSA